MFECNGSIWKLGDDIDTDIIIPTQYLAMKSVYDMKDFAFSALRKDLAGLISPGDVIVAGKNFGCGSSREQAPEVILALGVKCIIAKSFARIFYRNSFNNGLLLIENSKIQDNCNERDHIIVDQAQGILCNEKIYDFPVLPENLLKIIEDGGLVKRMQKINRNGADSSDSCRTNY
ncbi:LeuD/DmdB family oxidoreductase small subunit [Anaeromicropila populeti]|uniref:3-isopropylmalate/(R)-2-methylmalate dehydratase small subunit n=1 Tax=Anaeromicropila populeti TaxID=37658 RepID=A0A1I6HSF9_9FIRM|nr:3-isopropylmalate dehydratase [Anaeromicropila populeti]SFR57337.1 3-isopropylmalate/(R)-2-methylmalate dehydratase small subunit [Anaeromicropila populeti]